MDRRFIIPLLAAAAIVFACGPRPHARGETLATVRHGSALAGTTVKPVKHHHAKGGPDVDGSLSVHGDGAVEIALAVANASDHRVELAFPDGRTRDFAVYDAGGREVWRWSRGRLFTQGMQNALIAPGDSVVYRERWTPTAPGRYTLVAQLRSENYPLVRQVTFDVPAASTPAPALAVAAH